MTPDVRTPAEVADDGVSIEKIVRTRRRTLSIEIDADGLVVVRAPLSVGVGRIRQIVNLKRSWIEKRQRIARDRYPQTLAKTCREGEALLFLGQPYEIRAVDEAPGPLSFDGAFRVLRSDLCRARELMARWYREEAFRTIAERASWYAAQTNLRYRGIRVTEAKRRWGSCNFGGDLSFSWRLIMAPLEVVDYVVVHELVHLERKDHSRIFWARVAQILPEYYLRRKWLRENGHLLVL